MPYPSRLTDRVQFGTSHRSRVAPFVVTLNVVFCESTIMRQYTLVDCETGLIYGPYDTRAMARDHAELEGIATWEIITDDEKLVDWSPLDPIDRQMRHRKMPSRPGASIRNKDALHLRFSRMTCRSTM
jgi:hypothetical protein